MKSLLAILPLVVDGSVLYFADPGDQAGRTTLHACNIDSGKADGCRNITLPQNWHAGKKNFTNPLPQGIVVTDDGNLHVGASSGTTARGAVCAAPADGSGACKVNSGWIFDITSMASAGNNVYVATLNGWCEPSCPGSVLVCPSAGGIGSCKKFSQDGFWWVSGVKVRNGELLFQYTSDEVKQNSVTQINACNMSNSSDCRTIGSNWAYSNATFGLFDVNSDAVFGLRQEAPWSDKPYNLRGCSLSGDKCWDYILGMEHPSSIVATSDTVFVTDAGIARWGAPQVFACPATGGNCMKVGSGWNKQLTALAVSNGMLYVSHGYSNGDISNTMVLACPIAGGTAGYCKDTGFPGLLDFDSIIMEFCESCELKASVDRTIV